MIVDNIKDLEFILKPKNPAINGVKIKGCQKLSANHISSRNPSPCKDSSTAKKPKINVDARAISNSCLSVNVGKIFVTIHRYYRTVAIFPQIAA